MSLSIVTINYNNSQGLSRTLASISAQLETCFEHVIIDGMSDDSSQSVINAYSDLQDSAYSVSAIIEPDAGIYDAMNKGILNSSGQYIMFLNSGDVLSDEHVVGKILECISENGLLEAIYGNVLFKDDGQKVSRTWISGDYKRWKFLIGWMPPHPATIIRRDLFRQHGLFDINFKIAGDYELMLRFFYRNKAHLKYLDDEFVEMELGGVSTNGLGAIIKGNIECLRAWKANGYLVPVWLFFTKPLLKVVQLEFVRKLIRKQIEV